MLQFILLALVAVTFSNCAPMTGQSSVVSSRELQCWTCRSPNSAVCRNTGSWRSCQEPNSLCLNNIKRNQWGGVMRVTRGCRTMTTCNNFNAFPQENCKRFRSGRRVCRKCFNTTTPVIARWVTTEVQAPVPGDNTNSVHVSVSVNGSSSGGVHTSVSSSTGGSSAPGSGQPSEPNEPANPSEPSEPSEPVNPGEPSEPSEPVNPGEPSEPSGPSNPGEQPCPPSAEVCTEVNPWNYAWQNTIDATRLTPSGTFFLHFSKYTPVYKGNVLTFTTKSRDSFSLAHMEFEVIGLGSFPRETLVLYDAGGKELLRYPVIHSSLEPDRSVMDMRVDNVAKIEVIAEESCILIDLKMTLCQPESQS